MRASATLFMGEGYSSSTHTEPQVFAREHSRSGLFSIYIFQDNPKVTLDITRRMSGCAFFYLSTSKEIMKRQNDGMCLNEGYKLIKNCSSAVCT